MAVFFNAKKKKEGEEAPLYTGQVYTIPQEDARISVSNSKPTDVLASLETTNNIYDAIDLIVGETPDGKMAYNTYLRIANQGIKVEFFNSKNNRPLKKYDAEFRDFCAHMKGNSSNGLDGLLDQLHGSAITHGGMAVEVVVGSKLEGIDSVIVVDPKTITEFEWKEDKKRYAAYQGGGSGEKKDLFDGNFFWIPHQPKPGKPTGTIQFASAIDTMTGFYKLLRDSGAVLNRIGFPKYDVSIDMEKTLESATPQILSDPKKKKEYIQNVFETVKSSMRSIGRDSNIIHYDSLKVDVVGGGVNGSGIDVRAWYELYDCLIPNAFQLTPVLMGRLKSGSYSLGTAEYKIVKDNMEVLRRNSKRMLENIINLWARVKGYSVYAVVTHNPIEWQIEIDKNKALLLKLEKARRAEEYRYTDHESAAMLGMGDDAEPQEEQPDLYEYLSKNLSTSSNTNEEGNQTKEEGGNTDEE